MELHTSQSNLVSCWSGQIAVRGSPKQTPSPSLCGMDQCASKLFSQAHAQLLQMQQPGPLTFTVRAARMTAPPTPGVRQSGRARWGKVRCARRPILAASSGDAAAAMSDWMAAACRKSAGQAHVLEHLGAAVEAAL